MGLKPIFTFHDIVRQPKEKESVFQLNTTKLRIMCESHNYFKEVGNSRLSPFFESATTVMATRCSYLSFNFASLGGIPLMVWLFSSTSPKLPAKLGSIKEGSNEVSR